MRGDERGLERLFSRWFSCRSGGYAPHPVVASDPPPRPIAIYTLAAREAARLRSRAAAAVSMRLGARAPMMVALAMPLPWMAEGFLRAVRRFDEADVPGAVEAKDACIPLFEALSWLDAINETHEPPALKGNSDVRALRFIRNRQHHHKAAPIRRGEGVDSWVWLGAASIPRPSRSDYPEGEKGDDRYRRDLDKKGEGIYIDRLADKSVKDVLTRLAQRIGPLAC
jgi:hypothetical protein